MKTFLILFSFFSLLNLNRLSAQLIPTDSLERAFNVAPNDTSRLSVLLNLKIDNQLVRNDQTLVLFEKGLDIAQRIGDTKKTVQILVTALRRWHG